jgi:hypothetical protein
MEEVQEGLTIGSLLAINQGRVSRGPAFFIRPMATTLPRARIIDGEEGIADKVLIAGILRRLISVRHIRNLIA